MLVYILKRPKFKTFRGEKVYILAKDVGSRKKIGFKNAYFFRVTLI